MCYRANQFLVNFDFPLNYDRKGKWEWKDDSISCLFFIGAIEYFFILILGRASELSAVTQSSHATFGNELELGISLAVVPLID